MEGKGATRRTPGGLPGWKELKTTESIYLELEKLRLEEKKPRPTQGRIRVRPEPARDRVPFPLLKTRINQEVDKASQDSPPWGSGKCPRSAGQ